MNIFSRIGSIKKQDEIDEQLAAARRKAEIRRKQDEIDTLTEKLEIAQLEEENAKSKQVASQKKDLSRNEIQLEFAQSQKVTKQLEQSKGPQKCYRTVKAISTSTKPPTGTELRGRSSHSQDDMNGVTKRRNT